MKVINRLMTNVVAKDISASATFYTTYFDFNIDFTSDWFIHLISKDQSLELGLISPDAEILPKGIGETPNGFYLTFVVDDADEIYDMLSQSKVQIIQPPHDTFYGQRRLLIREMNGVVIDISSPV